jgi:hypothetical protein
LEVIDWLKLTMQRYCCALVKQHRIVRGQVGLTQQEVLLSKGLAPGTLNVHRPLIMELMLWLMMRSVVLHCSSDDFATLSGVTGCVAVDAVIFGFELVRLAASQG